MADSSGYANGDALVSTEWLAAHLDEPGYRLIEVDVNPAAYAEGHVQGAVGWDWKEDLQDPTIRDLASREALARKLGESGVTPDTTVLLYGESNNWFAAYAYWALEYYGHARVKLVDGGRVKWEKEGRPYTTAVTGVEPTSYPVPGRAARGAQGVQRPRSGAHRQGWPGGRALPGRVLG